MRQHFCRNNTDLSQEIDNTRKSVKEVEMGSWGITMRESDYGLDLLGTIVGTQLRAANFSTFIVADTLEVIKADLAVPNPMS